MVLIVDDHDDTRQVLRMLLKLDGREVHEARDGVEALAVLRNLLPRRPQVIILDVMMPKMDGVQTLREIVSDPDLRDIPVLMFSADSRSDRINEALSLGAKDYVPKGRE